MNSRKGFLAVVMLSAALLSACTSIGQSGFTPPSLTQSSLTRANVMPASNAPYLIGPTWVFVDADSRDRYACANGRPIVCESMSRLSSTAVCRCY